jgi:glucose-1-phosphate adenylyltransferase
VKNVLAILLAGSQGRRMDILCQTRPKPILPIGGTFRVIDYTLSNCVNSRCENIAVLVDHLREEMARYLMLWHEMNLHPVRFRILAPRFGSYLGTADAVYQNLNFIEQSGAEHVLILAGDHVYRMDYRRMLAFHERKDASATVGVVPLPAGQAHRFGIVYTAADGQVTGFEEKPPFARSNLTSMGIYLFKKDVLLRYLAEDAANTDSRHDFGYAIMPHLTGTNRIFAYLFKDYWRDIGTTEAYYKANLELLNHRPSSKKKPGNQPMFSVSKDHPVSQSQPGTVYNSIVSPGCVIKGRVENSVLSPGVWVDEQAVVRNSLLMENATVGFHSVVENTIADEDVHIGEYCYIGFGVTAYEADKRITVLGKQARVPPHTAVRCGCTVMPGIGREDFEATVISSGSNIARWERAAQTS